MKLLYWMHLQTFIFQIASWYLRKQEICRSLYITSILQYHWTVFHETKDVIFKDIVLIGLTKRCRLTVIIDISLFIASVVDSYSIKPHFKENSNIATNCVSVSWKIKKSVSQNWYLFSYLTPIFSTFKFFALPYIQIFGSLKFLEKWIKNRYCFIKDFAPGRSFTQVPLPCGKLSTRVEEITG